jgi:hypothetical protein
VAAHDPGIKIGHIDDPKKPMAILKVKLSTSAAAFNVI